MKNRSTSKALYPPISTQLPKTQQPSSKLPRKKAHPDDVSLQQARQILISLMFPPMMAVLSMTMTPVALPVIRDDFQIQADVTAWVASVYTLPFMILMPVYGRLSDSLGKRRLILAGISIFSIGTVIAIFAPGLGWLMAGRAIQGVGASGMMPLGMAVISTIFPTAERGKALGTWSSIGPTTGFVGPLFAGFLLAAWGWHAVFVPPLAVGVIAFVIVVKKVPTGLSAIKPESLRSFDWGGVTLLTLALTSLLFYLSSRPITGVDPLKDWRLLAAVVLFFGSFIWWEKRRQNPFITFALFSNKMFSLGSLSAGMRMFIMGAISFLLPLYLVDVHQLSAAHLGLMLMINPGAMMLMVRIGGQFSDRWGSRWPAMIGLSIQTTAMVILSQLSNDVSLWVVGAVLGYHGLGAGVVLAALHHAVLKTIRKEQMGEAAGIYGMIRFIGAICGTALAGVILKLFLDQQLPTIAAYQNVFLFFVGVGVLGVLSSLGLREAKDQ